MKTNILIWLTLMVSFGTLGQDCESSLEEARRAYYDGRFDEVISLLQPCSESENRSVRSDALELMAKAEILTGRDSTSDFHVAGLLEADPLYKYSRSELQSFKEIVDSYSINRKWSLGLRSGAVMPNIVITQYHSYASSALEPSSYETQVGFSGTLEGRYFLMPFLALSGGLQYQSLTYQFSELQLEAQEARVNDHMEYVGLPLQAELSLPIGSWHVEGGLGWQFQWLARSSGELSLFPIEGEIPTGLDAPAKVGTVDLTPWKNTWNHSFIAHLIVERRIGLYAVGLGTYYQGGQSNITNDDERWHDLEATHEYGYLPDDFTLSAWTIELSVRRYFFTPKKNVK
ncbi:hypothetical protein HZ996_00605 [Cryomorphaceae bacterium]|nr:hypothetical protein HZ996_00605 [Cryomorphaceae bacterium]